MAKKFFSLIIIPHSKASSKTITLSKRFIKSAAGSFFVVFVLLVVFLVDYFSMNVTREKYRNLLDENQQQKRALGDYESSVGMINKKIEYFENYAKKLNIMAGIKSPEVLREVGVGSGRNQENPEADVPEDDSQDISVSNLNLLSLKADRLEQKLTHLVGFYETQTARLASTPTIWPCVGLLTSPFGWRDDPFTGKRTFHWGIDIATNIGNQVIATADGIVVKVETDKMSGKAVLLSHGGGVATQYLHLDKFLVKPGQRVKRGDVIGLVGKTGKALGPHLHYEVQVNGKSVNPYYYILED